MTSTGDQQSPVLARTPVSAAGPSAAHSSADKSAAGAGQDRSRHAHGNPWFLALTALGVVYGDIGTSPLYAFQVALDRHRPSGPDRGRRSRHRVVDLLGADGDGVAEIRHLRAARRQRRRRRHSGAAVAGRGRPSRQWRQASGPRSARCGGCRVALRRRRHYAGDFGALGHGRAQAGRAGLPNIHRAGDAWRS